MKLILTSILATLLLAACGDGRVAGTNSETDTSFSTLSGTVTDRDNEPASGVLVRALPVMFNPRQSALDPDSLSVPTDAEGRFRLTGLDSGDYVVTATDGTSGFTVAATLTLEPSRNREWTARLGAPASLKVSVPLRFVHTGAYVYLPGTLYHVDLDPLGRAQLEGLPSGTAKPVLAYEAGTPEGVELPAFDTAGLIPGEGSAVAASGGTAPAIVKQVAPGDNLQAALDGLLPGDSLLLAGGRWELEGVTISSRGTASQGIYIGAVSGETPLLRGTSPNRNLVEFNGAAYVTVWGLEVDSTVPGTDAFKFAQSATSQNVTIRDSHIHHIRGIGINSEGSHVDVLIEGNHIHNVYGNPGTGIRVGGVGEPSGWIIQGNWIHDLGYGTPEQGYGINLTRGCRAMIVKDNMIHDASEGGILNYGTGLEDPQSSDWARIEGNAVWNVPEALGIYGDAAVKNNVLFDCGLAVFSSNRTGRSQWNVSVIHNTVHNCEEVRLNAWNDSSGTVFANNAVYGLGIGMTAPSGSFIYGNVGDVPRPDFTPGDAATDLRDPAVRDFYPLPGGALVDAALAPDTSMVDFLGAARDTAPDAGAYEYRSGFSGATEITGGFKP